MPDEIMICRVDPNAIEEYCWAMEGTEWQCAAIRPDMVRERVASGRTNSTPWQVMDAPGHDIPEDFDPRDWHEGRIAHLIVHPAEDPIRLEFDDFGSGMEAILQDGTHRLLAAIISGKEEVEVSFPERFMEDALEAFPGLVQVEDDAPEP